MAEWQSICSDFSSGRNFRASGIYDLRVLCVFYYKTRSYYGMD